METLIKIVTSVKDMILDRSQAGKITEKGAADFVTAVDLSVQNEIKQQLKIQFPEADFLGEEDKTSSFDRSKAVFVLDPVDGTTNLIHDYQMSAVSLALVENGIVTKGVVYNPFSEELFTAERGRGAYLNGIPIHVSGAAALSDALISIGTSPYEKERADKLFELLKHVFLKAQDIRRSGSAALDLCFVAAGRTDGYFEQNLKPWDFAAGSLILQEAGGIITNFSGGDINIFSNCDILAATAGHQRQSHDQRQHHC